jgi:CheY-like chemotaxis protein
MKKFNFIMLVDDDETCNYITEKMITKLDVSGHTMSLKNGKEAMNFIEEHCPDGFEMCPDVILLDINMPVMNGLEFLEEFFNNKTLQKYIDKINIYMLTSSDNPVDLEKIRQYGVKGYISKPMTPDKIMNLMYPS